MALVPAGESTVREEEIEQTTETSVSQVKKDLGDTKMQEDSASFHGTHQSKVVEEHGSSTQNLECSAKDIPQFAVQEQTTEDKPPLLLPDIYKPLEPLKKFEPLKPFAPLQPIEPPKSFEPIKQILSNSQLEQNLLQTNGHHEADHNQNIISMNQQYQLGANTYSVSTSTPVTRHFNSDGFAVDNGDPNSFELIKPLEIQSSVTSKHYEPLEPFEDSGENNESDIHKEVCTSQDAAEFKIERNDGTNTSINLEENKLTVVLHEQILENQLIVSGLSVSMELDDQTIEESRVKLLQSVEETEQPTENSKNSRNSLLTNESNQEPFELRTSTGELYVPVVPLEPLNLEDYLKPIVCTNDNFSAEIKQDRIKNSLKEIISDLDNYAEKDKELKEFSSQEETNPGNVMKDLLEQAPLRKQCNTPINQDVRVARLPSCTTPRPRPVSLPAENLLCLIKCAQIAQELNKFSKNNDEQDENQAPKPAISLEKLFTPADDALQIQPQPIRKVFASSSFYAKGLHPTMEEQVELAKRISSSLSDISNKTSKGQSMYVNRKKRSVKWVHEGEGKNISQNGDGREASGTKSPLKLVMNPHGQVHDIYSLRRQGYDIESALSPDICLEIVKDLNSPKGKGAELFAKRRKRSEKWVVGGDTNGEKPENILPDISPSPASNLTPLPSLNLPTPSYLPETTQRMQHNQKLDEIQERFTRPKVKLIKSPWDAALETGSVDAAFENVVPTWPIRGTYVAPVVDSYEQALRRDSLSTWRASPANGCNAPPDKVFAHNPAYNSNSINRIVDNLQKGVSNVGVYKPKHPQAWNSKTSQQAQYSSNTFPRTLPKAPPPPGFKAPTVTPPIFTPKESSTILTNYPPQPAYSSELTPQKTYQQVVTPTTPKLDVNGLQNYNTAARGWGQIKDFYKPITFEKPRSPFTDF